MRYAYVTFALLLLLHSMARGQTAMGGNATLGGKTAASVEGTITPPPPTGIPASFFKSSWNHIPPSTWPPTDSLHHTVPVAGARLWDDGLKLGQLFTVSGTTISTTTAFTNGLTNFINVTIPAFPMQVLYTFGDTPVGAGLLCSPSNTSTCDSTGHGIDPNCASPTSSSCIPFPDQDANSATCNASPNSNGSSQTAAVLANCGNFQVAGGANLWQRMIFQIVNTFKGKIAYYECWNEPDGAGNFWSNNAAFGGLGHAPTAPNQPPLVRLVRMCYDLKQIVAHVDPTARVQSPSFHGPTALTWMHYYTQSQVNDPGCSGACSAALGGSTWSAATVTGAQTYDINTAHLRGSSSGTGQGAANSIPENFLSTYANAQTEILNDHLPPLLVDDEWGCINTQTSAQCPTQDYLAYFTGASLIFRASVTNPGLLSEWYYQFDSAGGAGVISLQNTLGGTAFTTVAGWLTGSAFTGACAVTGTTWRCPILLANTHPAELKWNTASLSVNLTAVNASGVYTCSSPCGLLSGDTITITGFGNAANNGTFNITAATGTSITTSNGASVSQSGSASGSYQPLTCDASCPTYTSDGFTGTWTNLVGTSHPISGGQVPSTTKPILIQ